MGYLSYGEVNTNLHITKISWHFINAQNSLCLYIHKKKHNSQQKYWELINTILTILKNLELFKFHVLPVFKLFHFMCFINLIKKVEDS